MLVQPSRSEPGDIPESVARYRYRIYWWACVVTLVVLAAVVIIASNRQAILGIYFATAYLITSGYLFFIKKRTRLATWIHLLGSIAATTVAAMRDGQSHSEILWLMPTSNMIGAYLLNRKQWLYFTGICVACVIGVCLSELVWQIPDRMPRSPSLVFAFQTVTLLIYAAFAVVSMVSIDRLIFRVETKNHALEESKREIDKSLNVKARFLAGLSNETQEPMRAILRQVASADDQVLPPRQREALSIIEENIGTMVHMVKNIEEYSKIQNGDLEVSVSESGVVGLLDELRADWEPRMQEQGVTLQVKGQLNEDRILRSDFESLRSILDHLLTNAMDHSPGGSVLLEVRVSETLLEIFVQDDGPGIADEDAAQLFEAFAREDCASVDSRRGLGLGLAIVKSRLALVGGSIDVSPAPDRGSVFRVQVPLGSEPELAPELAPQAAPQVTKAAA